MNNLKTMYAKKAGFRQFAAEYFAYLGKLLSELDLSAVEELLREFERSRESGNTVLIAGNGGSAATASHMANDMALGTWCGEGTKPFRVISVTDNNAVMTAIGNDNGFEHVFLHQLKMIYRPGDRLIVISASGNSMNLVTAVEWVKKNGGKTIGLLGFDGGKLAKLCDLVILVKTPKGEYAPVEDVHMILDHLVLSYLQYHHAAVKANY